MVPFWRTGCFSQPQKCTTVSALQQSYSPYAYNSCLFLQLGNVQSFQRDFVNGCLKELIDRYINPDMSTRIKFLDISPPDKNLPDISTGYKSPDIISMIWCRSGGLGQRMRPFGESLSRSPHYVCSWNKLSVRFTY